MFGNLFGGLKADAKIDDFKQRGAKIIDVRSPGEFSMGHADGAVNIPLDQLPKSMKKVGPKDKAYLLCCASGGRSAQATSYLQQQGYSDLLNAGAWQNLN